MSIYTKAFWKAATERSVKTFAQTAGATLAASGAGLIEADWLGAGSVAGMAAVLSLLFSIGSDAATGDGPSLTEAEVLSDGEGH